MHTCDLCVKYILKELFSSFTVQYGLVNAKLSSSLLPTLTLWVNTLTQCLRMCANVRHKACACWHEPMSVFQAFLKNLDIIWVWENIFFKKEEVWGNQKVLQWEWMCASYLVTVTLHHGIDGLFHQISTWHRRVHVSDGTKHKLLRK